MYIYFYIGQCRKQRAAKCECRIVIDHSFRTERPVANTDAGTLCSHTWQWGLHASVGRTRERETGGVRSNDGASALCPIVCPNVSICFNGIRISIWGWRIIHRTLLTMTTYRSFNIFSLFLVQICTGNVWKHPIRVNKQYIFYKLRERKRGR